MQSLFNQFVCPFVQALLIYFLHTLLSLFLTWYWLYCSISCAPPRCKGVLSRQILQQSVWELYNHNLSWAHVQLSIQMNSKVVTRWGNTQLRTYLFQQSGGMLGMWQHGFRVVFRCLVFSVDIQEVVPTSVCVWCYSTVTSVGTAELGSFSRHWIFVCC